MTKDYIIKIKLDNDEAIEIKGIDYEDVLKALDAVSNGCKWIIIEDLIINIDKIMYIEKIKNIY